MASSHFYSHQIHDPTIRIIQSVSNTPCIPSNRTHTPLHRISPIANIPNAHTVSKDQSDITAWLRSRYIRARGWFVIDIGSKLSLNSSQTPRPSNSTITTNTMHHFISFFYSQSHLTIHHDVVDHLFVLQATSVICHSSGGGNEEAYRAAITRAIRAAVASTGRRTAAVTHFDVCS
ncbi:hypothetical protein K469DRAFT_4695 [Zopfia rhizophila CBS 207.26]|uniref:Uncharacterized protein n=1 Tax=Zopfia rhizophila CBS 207.26 TaxID=1314779 RepID=A0A6A6EWL8_9PEZI|nr:hypothetical protein K469DRAFT_4695 [Zopfia rhizophila CBS 207.26]